MIKRVPEEILESYVFANTPSYLFKKMNASDYVLQLTNENTNILFKMLDEANPDKPSTIPSAYAALLALLRKNVDESKLREKDGLNKLEWGSAIIKIFQQKSPSTNQKTFRVPSMVKNLSNEKISYTVTKIKE